MKINLSGLENLAIELYSKTEDKELVAAFVFEYIGNAISAMCEEYTETYGDAEFVFAGGVMSNTIIRRKLEERFKACFAEPEFSTDNAVGIAELARRADMKEV
jgi:N6-L-threonylcarbamoyladenine synthase